MRAKRRSYRQLFSVDDFRLSQSLFRKEKFSNITDTLLAQQDESPKRKKPKTNKRRADEYGDLSSRCVGGGSL